MSGDEESKVNDTLRRDDYKRDEDFGLGTFDDLLKVVLYLCQMIIPQERVRIEGSESQKRVRLEYHFKSNRNIGLFLGRGKENLKALSRIGRIQQMFPHDRFIQHVVFKEDGSTQQFWDLEVSKRNVEVPDHLKQYDLYYDWDEDPDGRSDEVQ